MSLSLIAVFIPILLMGGIVGRLFREFAVTLSIAILISMVVSLTTTPMMCAFVLQAARSKDGEPGRFFRWQRAAASTRCRTATAARLRLVLRHPLATMLVFLGTVILNIYPATCRSRRASSRSRTPAASSAASAPTRASPSSRCAGSSASSCDIIREDPAIENVAGFTGGFQTNSGFLFATLKPLSERKESADQVIARLRPKLAQVPGANVFLQAVQDIRVGGRQGNSQYQFTLAGRFAARSLCLGAEAGRGAATQTPSVITDVNSDQQQRGLQVNLTIDRDAAARLGVSSRAISSTLYDAFGQRQVSTIYNALNQYHVVMEVAPDTGRIPKSLKDIYVSTSGGAISGAQATAAVVQHGLDRRQDRRADRRRRDLLDPSSRGAQPAHQCDRRQRPRLGLDRGRGQHRAGNHDPAVGRHQLRVRHHAARRQPPGPVRRQHHFLQPGGGQDAERRRGLS